MSIEVRSGAQLVLMCHFDSGFNWESVCQYLLNGNDDQDVVVIVVMKIALKMALVIPLKHHNKSLYRFFV